MSGAPGDPRVVLSGRGFALGPPSSFPKPETDKIDLDSGYRGYGPIVEQWGVDSQPDAGGRTEIIIEDTQVHTFDSDERTVALLSRGEPGDYASCKIALAREDGRVARVSLGDLGVGSRMCVSTDEKRVALVTVDAVSSGPVLTISYTTWAG
ncbi:hypothetical protein ACFQ3A_23530 [Sphaerisporangium aureirubrum]